MKINGKRVITTDDVEFFRRRCGIGTILDCMVLSGEADSKTANEKRDVCRITGKGKHTARTDQGTMQWSLLTIWNMDQLFKWEEEDKRRRHENSIYFQPQWGEG